MPYYGYDMEDVVSLHQLVSNAILLSDAKSEESETAGESENE
jgi:hypothetical protein